MDKARREIERGQVGAVRSIGMDGGEGICDARCGLQEARADLAVERHPSAGAVGVLVDIALERGLGPTRLDRLDEAEIYRSSFIVEFVLTGFGKDRVRGRLD